MQRQKMQHYTDVILKKKNNLDTQNHISPTQCLTALPTHFIILPIPTMQHITVFIMRSFLTDRPFHRYRKSRGEIGQPLSSVKI